MKDQNKEKINQLLNHIQDVMVEIQGLLDCDEDQNHPKQPLDHEELK